MLNVVVLIGRLTADPELRHTGSDIPVASFTLAVDRRYSKNSEERQTDFINIVSWRSTAEFVTKYFKKGQQMAVEGSIQTRKYQDKDGNNRTAVEVVANNVSFVEPKNASSRSASPEQSGAPAQAVPTVSNADANDFSEIISDDDLPF